MKLLFRSVNIVISLALIIAAAFLVYVALPYFGNKALIVRSGSMQPAIDVGDLVVVHANSQVAVPAPGNFPKYNKGDIIAFSGEKDLKIITTHRIVSSQTQGNQLLYQTQGDANNTPDQRLVPENKIIGKTTFTIPSLGKIFALVKTKAGFLSLVVAPAILVIILELTSIVREILKSRRKENTNVAHAQDFYPNSTLLRVFLPIVIGIMFFEGSFSSYADTESSSGNALEAAATFPLTDSPSPNPNESPSPLPEPITNHLVISEVQIDRGTGNLNDHDFIEIYNPTNSPVNLSGFRLVKRGSADPTDDNIFTFTSSNIIPAHGFFLWAHNSTGNNYAAIITADVSSADVLGGNNSIAIRQGALDTGTIIDALSWDSAASSLKEGLDFFPDPTDNQSLERKALSTSSSITMLGTDSLKGNGFDTDSNATDFTVRIISQPQNSASPTETP